jgi:hypothetical protein
VGCHQVGGNPTRRATTDNDDTFFIAAHEKSLFY